MTARFSAPGVTVIVPRRAVALRRRVRGGGPEPEKPDTLALGGSSTAFHAIVLSGGLFLWSRRSPIAVCAELGR